MRVSGAGDEDGAALVRAGGVRANAIRPYSPRRGEPLGMRANTPDFAKQTPTPCSGRRRAQHEEDAAAYGLRRVGRRRWSARLRGVLRRYGDGDGPAG